MEEQFPATPRGKKLWPQKWRLPRSLQGPRLLQRLSSFPGPAQACGRASLSWAAAALHPSPACAQLGDTGALCFCSRLDDAQWAFEMRHDMSKPADANANFQEFDFSWQLTEEKQSFFFFFLYLYVVIFILIFRVCSYGKQELSEAYLLLWDE